MGNHPKILITYVLTGAGHYAPAKAVNDYLQETYQDNPDMRLCDFFKDIGKTDIDNFLINTCNSMVKHPNFNIWGHEVLKKLTFLPRLWVYLKFRSSVKPAAAFVKRENPDIIVSHHGFTAYVLEKVRKKYGYTFTLLSVNTDPYASHVFLEMLKDQDFIIVSSNTAGNKLQKAGIPKNKIVNLPFPVSRKFDPAITVSRGYLKDSGLDPDKKTMLITFGGDGAGDVTQYIETLHTAAIPLNLIIVTGRNSAMLSKLKTEVPQGPYGSLNILALGYVDNMHELLAVSDICFIKPGASSTYESLIMRKPIIFYQLLSHIEAANVTFAMENKVAFYVGKNINRFLNTVKECIKDQTLQAIQRSYDAMLLENGTESIGEFIYNLSRQEQKSPRK
jgi:processive 1,2-diacylglycerol beta-glucosyltransferase